MIPIDYWVKKIKEYDDLADVKTNGIELEAVIKEQHIIRFNTNVNSLQYYRKISYLPEFKDSCRKEEYICAYGDREKSILIALKDIQAYISKELDIINTDWNKKCLKSIYHESKKDEFYLKVLKVEYHTPTGFIGFKELCLLTDKLNEEQNIQGGESWLRASLIGVFYKIVDIPKQEKKNPSYVQTTIFDF